MTELLKENWPDLYSYYQSASSYVGKDDEVAIIKFGILCEDIVKRIFKYEGIEELADTMTQYYRLRLLSQKDILPENITDIL